jgi:hypothetical protein
MSTAATILEENGVTRNRRGCPREPLKWVVLVYFGEDNWGKLLNLTENGMCFEFAETPPPGQRINFSFEAMGRMPASFGGEVVSNMFQAAGEIKWMREFERIAGVQFANLSEDSRDQIRRWLSFEASAETVTVGDGAKPEAPAQQPELLEPVQSLAETVGKEADLEQSAPGSGKSESGVGVEAHGTLEPQLVAKILEAPNFQAYSKLMAEEERKSRPASDSRNWMTRIGPVTVTVSIQTPSTLSSWRDWMARADDRLAGKKA